MTETNPQPATPAEPPPPQPGAPVPAQAPGHASAPAPRARATALRLAAIFVASLLVCALAYLAVAVPGKWFTGVQPLAWGARDLQVTRGAGRIVGDELHVLPNDPSGIVVVSVVTKFSSLDLAQVAWIAIDVPDDVEASALWRSDYKPDALNTLPLPALTGRLLPAAVGKHAAWIGRIEGLALAIRGPISEPIRIRGVIVRPLDAPEIARERVREWFAFEGWTGTSINTITGGADLQDLPLPLLLAAAAVLASLAVALLRRWRPAWFPLGALGSLAAFALAAWLLLDLRWAWNLARQVEQTAATLAFRGFDEKRLAVEDGPLYAFVAKAREAMPKEPARVFVVADSHYFRGRAAYHLSPHRAFFDPRVNSLPAPESLRPGDWLLVWQRKGVQFDQSQGKLRWNNLTPVSAELKLAGRGAALFQIR
ncbi:MAG: hypothetical protein OEX23_15685 [Betaproteobacteria bacterium]|nr:hypothetical protein [Betaproteobacteria bacterium]